MVYTCMCVSAHVELECMTVPLPSMRQHLREAAMEMCAPPQHKHLHTHTHTHSDKQMLCVFCAGPPSFGLCLFSENSSSSIHSLYSLLSVCPVVNVKQTGGGLFLSRLNPPRFHCGALIMPSLSSLISTSQVNLLRGTALRLSQS